MKLAIAVIVLLTVGYFVIHIPQIQKPDTTPYYSNVVTSYLDSCSLGHIPDQRAPLKLYLACVSEQVFHNPRVVTLFFSTALIPITFLLARKITDSYPISVIATLVFCSSKIFEFYVNQVGFEQSWSVLFLGSLLLAYRKPILSGPTLLLSLFSKGLPLFFIPFLLYIVHNSKKIKYKKIEYIGILGVLVFVVLFTLFVNQTIIQDISVKFTSSGLQSGIQSLYSVFRHDQLQFFLFGLAVTNLGFLAYSGDKSSKALMVFIIGYYASVIIFPTFTIYAQYDYRMIPMIVIDSIASMLILKNPNIIYYIMEATPITISKAIEITHFRFAKS